MNPNEKKNKFFFYLKKKVTSKKRIHMDETNAK